MIECSEHLQKVTLGELPTNTVMSRKASTSQSLAENDLRMEDVMMIQWIYRDPLPTQAVCEFPLQARNRCDSRHMFLNIEIFRFKEGTNVHCWQ